jgi:hypothetical protein
VGPLADVISASETVRLSGTGDTCTVALELVPSCPVTVRVKVSGVDPVGMTNVAFAVVAPVRLTAEPPVCVHW